MSMIKHKAGANVSEATREKYGDMLSWPTDLFKFEEFIMFITSFTRGGSMKIDGLTLF